MTKERITQLNDRTIEIAQSEKQTSTTIKQQINKASETCELMKKTHTKKTHNTHHWSPRKSVYPKKKKKENLKKIMVAENFSNLTKDPTDPRSWANPKHGKLEEIHIKTHRQKSEKFTEKEN